MGVRDWALDFGHRLFLAEKVRYRRRGVKMIVEDADKFTSYRFHLVHRMIVGSVFATVLLAWMIWYTVTVWG